MLTSMLSFVKWGLASLSISISPGTAWQDMGGTYGKALCGIHTFHVE